jgi:hypothetical protein
MIEAFRDNSCRRRLTGDPDKNCRQRLGRLRWAFTRCINARNQLVVKCGGGPEASLSDGRSIPNRVCGRLYRRVDNRKRHQFIRDRAFIDLGRAPLALAAKRRFGIKRNGASSRQHKETPMEPLHEALRLIKRQTAMI